jgi:hypothetical protein
MHVIFLLILSPLLAAAPSSAMEVAAMEGIHAMLSLSFLDHKKEQH